MLSRSNIRGATLLVAIIIVAILIAAFIRPRVQTFYDERESNGEIYTRDSLFEFDPNTVTYEELRTMGFAKDIAVGIVKYRARGKVFAIKEDFALCYGITDSAYQRLKPYINIGEQFAAKPQPRTADRTRDTLPRERRFFPRPTEPFGIDTVGYAYLRRIGFSARQARALLKYRDRFGGIRDMDELRDCYFIDEDMADTLERYVVFPEPDPHEGLVEINSADSATLRGVAGIGAKTVVAIIEYRRLLGGFRSTDQIAELKCVTKENFERISKQIYCDSCVISKIDINFAPASELERHPYMTREAINRITKLRKSKGGWNSVEEMIEDDIFGREQATALAPYLRFGDRPADFD